MNTRSRLFAVFVAVTIAITAIFSGHGQDAEFKPPGSEEAAAVARANAALDKVYKELMSKLEAGQQKRLKEAQRAWIKWRDEEAEFSARLGGAVGGSALRVDYATVQRELIEQRTEVLEGYLDHAENND